MMFSALLLNRPIVLMYGLRPATPSLSKASGVVATGDSLRVLRSGVERETTQTIS